MAAAARDVRRPLAVLTPRPVFALARPLRRTDDRRRGGRSCRARILRWTRSRSRGRAIAMARRDLRRRIRASSSEFAASCCSARERPANDMIGEGLIGRFAFSDAWQPRRRARQRDVRLRDAEPSARHSGHDRRRRHQQLAPHQRARRAALRRRSGAGAGTGSRGSATPTSSRSRTSRAQRADGGTFDIATTADDELHVFAGGGAHREIKRRWLLDTSLTIEHHDTHYELIDRSRARRGTIGAQTVYGIAIGVSYRF